MTKLKINWFGLAGGIATSLLIVISLFFPWWQFTVGDGILQANISPLNTNFDFLSENSVTVPLLWALNLVSILSLAASGIIMLIYSVLPSKSYSSKLLDFSYRKPIYAVVFFVISLFSLILIIQSLLGFQIPIMGSATIQLPQSLTAGTIVSTKVTADFLWPFWFAVIAAGLCVIARIYHRRIAEQPMQQKK